MPNRIPSTAPVAAMSLSPTKPGQIVHVPLSGARPIVFNRDPGRWFGSLSLNRVGIGKEDIGNDIETWLTALDGQNEIGEVDIQRPALPVPAGTTVAAVFIGSNHVRVTPSVNIPGASSRYWVRIVNRIYKIISVDASGPVRILNLWPPALPTVGDEIEPGKWMRIIRSQEAQRLVHTPAFYGPWSLEFQEYPWADV